MFSRLKYFYSRKGLHSFLKFQRPNQSQTIPISLCNDAASSDRSINVHEIDVDLFSKIFPQPDHIEKCSSIVEDIQKAIAANKRYPQFMNTDEIRVLYSLESRSQRKGYLAFLFRKEKYRIADAEKKEKKQSERESWEPMRFRSEFDHGDIKYGVGNNTLLLSVRSHSINKFYHKRLANAVLFGRKIVLDLGYEDYMTEKELRNTAVQLKLVCSFNRKNSNPYDVYFCNANETSKCVRYFKTGLPKFDEAMFTVTDKSFSDVFPKEQLVYLSPHAQETLKEYDHNAIYIIETICEPWGSTIYKIVTKQQNVFEGDNDAFGATDKIIISGHKSLIKLLKQLLNLEH